LIGWFYLESPRWAADGDAVLAVIAAPAGPALMLLEAEQRYAGQVAQLHTLAEIGRVLSGVLDLDTLLDAIYSATSQVVDAPDFYIGLFDDASGMLDLAYHVLDGQRARTRFRWRADQGLAGVIIAQRAPLRTDNYRAECDRRGIAPVHFGNTPVSNAWIGVPLYANDRFVGIMTVASRRDGYTYTADHVDVLVSLAAQAAVAIENARLYQRSEQQARQLAALNRIGRSITSSLDPERVPSLIMEQVCDLLDVEEGSLLLADEASGELVFAYTMGPVGSRLLGQRLPAGVGLAGYVVSSGESVMANDAQQDDRLYKATDHATGYITRSLLAVPLRGVGGVQGVIEVINRRDNRPFVEEDQRLLEAVADQAVIALENARKFAQVDQALARRAQELTRTNDLLQHNLRSLTALNALGLAINTSMLRPDEIFAMTARSVVEMTDALSAFVLLPETQASAERFRVAVHIGPVADALLVEDLAYRVIQSGRPEATRSDEVPGLALLGVPLRATQRTLGALCVCYADALPDAPDQEMVTLFATQAAGAVKSIELFRAVSGARDQMASILASIREGIVLIEPDTRVAIANSAFHQLSRLAPPVTASAPIDDLLRAWEAVAVYPPEEWAGLRRGIEAVIAGRERFASGELNAAAPGVRSFEWAALTAHDSGDSRGGSLLVLRDISDAKAAEQLRLDLTNMIVHDLRSPLSSMMASIDLLVRGVPGTLNDTQRNVLNIASTSSLQMLDMVNLLLDISRLEDGRMPLEPTEVPVASLVDRAIGRLIQLARERQIAVQVDLPDHMPHVLVDSELIVRVFQNLIGNAIKFSSRLSTVLVRACVADDPEPPGPNMPAQRYICLAVEDDGIGIALKDQERIFSKFGQVGERRGGTGLGLNFCKLVVEAHGGRIWVRSAPGEGSTFCFILPVAR
jgi:K+-sensing histidine kinase KdpD